MVVFSNKEDTHTTTILKLQGRQHLEIQAIPTAKMVFHHHTTTLQVLVGLVDLVKRTWQAQQQQPRLPFMLVQQIREFIF